MTLSREKHTSYYDLLESLGQAKICVFCEMRMRYTHNTLDSLLYENVNDPGLRKKLVESHGFCRHHADLLLSKEDSLGTALLYRDQVQLALQSLQNLNEKSSRWLWIKGARIENEEASCPLCVQADQHDQQRIETLLAFFHEPEMTTALEKSPGFCLPHLKKVLVSVHNQRVYDHLLEFHQRCFHALLEDLELFCQKQIHSDNHPTFGREADSWKRAVDMLLGKL